MNKLCKSCSGPLDGYQKDEILAEGLCPHCVDQQGHLKGYQEILEGMIEYIEQDHPEVPEEKKLEQAVTWLREGPIWGEKFTGKAVKEVLENVSLGKLLEIRKPSDSENGLIHFEFYRTELEKVQAALKVRLRKKTHWAELTGAGKTYVLFKNRLFIGSKNDEAFVKEIHEFAKDLGIKSDLMPLN